MFKIMHILWLLLWMCGGVRPEMKKYETEVCKGNTACMLAARTRALMSNDSCWVCHSLHATPSVHPFVPGNFSPCAAALTPECADGDCPDGQEGLENRFQFNQLLTVMNVLYTKAKGLSLDIDQFSRRTQLSDTPQRMIDKISEAPESIIIRKDGVDEDGVDDQVHFPATNCSNFPHDGDIFVPHDNHALQVLTVTETPGLICIRLADEENTKRQHLGDSVCEVYWQMNWRWTQVNPATPVRKERIVVNTNGLTRLYAISQVANFPLPHGYWWVCGNKAYSRWPVGTTGTCYVGAIAPSVAVHSQHELFGEIRKNGRQKRDVRDVEEEDKYGNHLRHAWTGYDSFNGYVMESPWTAKSQGVGLTLSMFGGVSASLMKINYLAWALQNVANDTAMSVSLVGHDLKMMRTELVSHRLALDILLAEKGGLCHVVNVSCCFLVPDHFDNYTSLAKQIKGLMPNAPPPTTLDLVFGNWAHYLGDMVTSVLMNMVKAFLPFLIPFVILYVILMFSKTMVTCVIHRLAAKQRVEKLETKPEAEVFQMVVLGHLDQ